MATPLFSAPETTRLALTVHLTADADRLPDLFGALSALGTVESIDPLPGVVVPLPRSAPLRLAVGSRKVFWRGREVALTRLEFDLLHHLVARQARVHRRRALMAEVWHTTYVSERTVDVHVRRLRGKINADRELIRTVRGVGYQFSDPTLAFVEI
ncbi:winged helix-turn-helix domain-containing protein [Actinokineospora xionganensis]|uniref:Winged helix-turn-helix transcriptional regulator n=1 Tax=Actinokineospora xionganensis TaxID=2684470 RepID=A0ABR7L6L4_9PSEU|nr:winged helix-turn-helix domain-containing protein [Actinokineospora xionganensis]MBC6448173.1 winged helix-turn-helix transcriptional regulator [Actinokineospora xionganensis]